MRVVELAGGVGGAKLAHGLQAEVGNELTVVVNTGDDLERHGLAIWPDHDTVMYTLAGRDDRERGWGLAGETWAVIDALGALGQDTWFRLGDRDIATHLVRSERLRRGARPTEVALELQAAFGLSGRVLPMSDVPVRTQVLTDDGWLEFQEYFVHRHQEPAVRDVRFAGVETALVTPEVREAVAAAEIVVIAPSNPIVSIGPILAVPGIREAIAEARARGVPVAAISGIVGGVALKGPADRMLASLGEESSALGVARRYAGLVDLFVIDEVDAPLRGGIEELGMRVLVTATVMTDDRARAALARRTLEAAAGGSA